MIVAAKILLSAWKPSRSTVSLYFLKLLCFVLICLCSLHAAVLDETVADAAARESLRHPRNWSSFVEKLAGKVALTDVFLQHKNCILKILSAGVSVAK